MTQNTLSRRALLAAGCAAALLAPLAAHSQAIRTGRSR